MDQKERNKVKAIYVFEAVLVAYFIGIILAQIWVVYWR
jgi:hypothetical protein